VLNAIIFYVREYPRVAMALAIALIAAAVPFVPFLSVFFGTGTEVAYKGSIVTSTCAGGLMGGPAARALCVSIYEVDVGNTGDVAQPEVRVTFHNAPTLPTVNHRVLDIVATNDKHRTPRVEWEAVGKEPVLVIRDLDPNVLVHISYTALGPKAAIRLRDMKLSAQARGRVINVDPKATAVWRAIRAAMQMFL
jgi:hypothetical protein